MARAIWKGAISFGLVHIPVGLVSASSSIGVDFDWLDARSMEPVGYKRVNKITGKEIKKENIVKGVKYEKGRYVVISEDEIRAAHPKATQTIDIFSFIDADKIPLPNIDTPYYLAPDKRGEKVYALLRETLSKTNKVALARVIIRTREHLAALMPLDSALILVMLRWPAEVRELDVIDLNEAVTDATLKKGELDMAKRLVDDMTSDWQPDEYEDTFTEKIMQLVEQKARAGKIEQVEDADNDEPQKASNVIDLTELLKRSLGGKANDKPTTKSTGKATKKTDTKTKSKSKAKTKAETKEKAEEKEKTKAAKSNSKNSKSAPTKKVTKTKPAEAKKTTSTAKKSSSKNKNTSSTTTKKAASR